MDLNEIIVFVKVVQVGSFNKAAQELNMPNSTVSAKVLSLEKRLGLTLLQRTTRKLNLTEAGHLFFQRCLQGVEEIRQAESEVTLSQKNPQGTLRITAPIALGNSLLPQVIAAFSEKFPMVQLEVILTDTQIDLIGKNIDVAFRTGDLKDSSLIAKKLGTTYFAPFAHPSYLKKNGTPTHPKDLRKFQCLQFSPMNQGQWQFVHDQKNKVSIPLPETVKIDSLELIKKLTLMGSGISLLPTFLCEVEIKNQKLIRILPEWCADRRTISLVYPAQRYMTPKLKVFIDLASQLLKQQLASLEV